MKLAFTGTKRGLTREQAEVLDGVFVSAYVLHHGDCVGADSDAHSVARRHGLRVVGHPPTDDKLRAWCVFDEEMPPAPYLERNHDIVDDAGLVLACPGENHEVLRSGTWATVRYAVAQGVATLVVWPDGTVVPGARALHPESWPGD